MCLGIPGQIVAIEDAERALAKVEIAGVRRLVNLVCILDPAQPLQSHPDAYLGAWVLVHVGFAMSRLDETEAARTLELLTQLGELQTERQAIEGSAR